MKTYNEWVCNCKFEKLKKKKQTLESSETKITVKIKYCGVCGSDVHIKNGEWGDTFPQILGHEIIGVIEHIPENTATTLSVNDIVGVGWQSCSCQACSYCQNNQEYFCDKAGFTSFNSNQGGFAEYIQVEPQFTIPIPECSQDRLASMAPFMCGGITAFKPLYSNFGNYKSLAIVGFGGIGTMAVKFGKTMYDSVHVISSSNAKEMFAKSLGADTFSIFPIDNESKHFDLALVTSSHKIDINNLINCMNKGGKIVIIGISVESLNLNTDNLVDKEIHIEGTNTGSPNLIKTMLHWIVKYKINLPVEVVPIDQVNQVLDDMENRKLTKRTVLEIHSEQIQFQQKQEISSLKYRYELHPVKGYVLKSKITCKAGELFTVYQGLHIKQLTQHSLFDYARGLNIVDVDKSKIGIPYYLQHSENPNLQLVFPGNKIYCLRDISVDDNLSMNYNYNEPVLYKQFENQEDKIQWVIGYREKPNANGLNTLGYIYNANHDIFSYNNIKYNENNHLHFQNLDINSIISMYDPNIPLFIYSKVSMNKNINRIKYFLGKYFPKFKLHFSIKSNSMPNILSQLRMYDLHYLDACSPSEVLMGMTCGYKPEHIQYTSSYLSDSDMDILNRIGGLKMNVDSFTMLENVQHKSIGLRINPMAGMSYNCQKNLQCTFGGNKPSKMGFVLQDVAKVCKIAKAKGKIIERLHCHAGNSYLTDDLYKEFTNILGVIKSAVAICLEHGFSIKEINLGGGYGVPYKASDRPFDWDKWMGLVNSVLDTQNVCISIEPGDYIMKSSGLLVARVNTVERKLNTTFVGLNVGMNLNGLPAYYDIMSLPVPTIKKEGTMIVDVVGNINESIDVWAKNLTITTVERGDFIVLLNSGGYAESCRSLHSLRTQYNQIII